MPDDKTKAKVRMPMPKPGTRVSMAKGGGSKVTPEPKLKPIPAGGPTTRSGGGYAEWDEPQESGPPIHHRVYMPPSGGGSPIYTEGPRKGQVIGEEDIPEGAAPGGGIVGPGYQPPGAPTPTPGELQQVQQWQRGAMGARPPEGRGAPDYGPAGRESFENTLFEQIGMNPFTYNIHEELERAVQEALPQLFDMVFQGQVYYGDINKLDREQYAYWDNALKGFRAHIFQQLQAKHDTAMNEYNWSMNKWDAVAKEKKAIDERRRKERGEALEDPTTPMTENQGVALVARNYRIEKEIVPTPDVQEEYNVAMKAFWLFREQGMDPGRAATESTKQASQVMKLYWSRLKEYSGDKEKTKRFQAAFKEKYGFLPSTPRR